MKIVTNSFILAFLVPCSMTFSMNDRGLEGYFRRQEQCKSIAQSFGTVVQEARAEQRWLSMIIFVTVPQHTPDTEIEALRTNIAHKIRQEVLFPDETEVAVVALIR